MSEQSEFEEFKNWREDFIKRAGFKYGWHELESWARRMAEQAYLERKDKEIAALRKALEASNTWLYGLDNVGQAKRRELNQSLIDRLGETE